MNYKRTQKRSKQMWQRVEKFSIRKFSFGAASCLIGASLVGAAGTVQPVEAALTYEKTGDKTARTLYTNLGDSPNEATGSGVRDVVDVDKEIQINVDWSQYSKTNPYVKVTYKFNGGYGASALYHYGGGRPEFWFTTPIGVKEPRKITLYNGGTGPQGRVMTSWKGSQGWISGSNSVGSRYQNEAAAKALNAGDPTKWEWYNDTTGESGKTYRGDLDAMFWWRMGDTIAGKPGDQAIYQLFKDNTKSFYADWERAAHQSVTIEAEYEVVDPTLKNERYTLDFGAGVKVGHAGSLRSRFKVATEQVPALYKNTEFFEPKLPERLGVANTTNLTQKEKDKLKEKIWEANQDNTSSSLPEGQNKFVDNLKDGKEGIQIGNDGTATITYKDNSTDVIPGTSLVYEDPNAAETKLAEKSGYNYHKNPLPVENLDKIGQSEVDEGVARFKEINGIKTDEQGIITSVGEGVSSNFIDKILSPYSKVVGTPKEGELPETNFVRLSILNKDRTPTNVAIPKEDLFKQKVVLDDTAIAEAREKGKKAIEDLIFLSPKEKEVFKKELEGKTSQEDINSVVNTAISRNYKNEKGIAEKKLEVKKGIDALTYLTNAEKEELRKKVDDQGIADPENTDGSEGKALDHTKSLLDKILTDATATNLAKAKEKAKEQIEKIKDSLTPEKVEQFKNKIESADSVSKIEEILKEAETLKAKNEADKAKAEADKLKEDYKKKIDQIPGLSDEDKANYKKQIDEATSKDQLDRILKDAEEKVSREQARTDAKDIIDGLTHLNNAQKTELKEQVAAAGGKEELDRIVNAARDLDSKMDSLQQLVAEAEKVKGSDKYNSADQDKKTAFDKAKEAASKVADKNTEAPENAADASEVSTLIENLAKAIKELTGQEIAVPVSKDALKAEIDESDAIKNSVAYAKETSADKKKAYDDALANAQKVYDKQDATQPEVDDALAKLQEARTALSGKVEDFTLALKNSDAVKISKIPVAGEALSDTDKAIVKDSVTANNEALKQDETVTYGNITEKDGKTYVKVTVTRDGVSKEIEVPVEGTEAAKSPLKDPEKVKVTDPKKLTPEEQTAVKEAVKKANDTLKDNQITVDEQGNVTVTYSDQSQNKLPASKTVEAKTEAEKALDKAKEKAKADLTEAANKEKAEIEADKTLTEDQKKAEKDKVDKVKEEQEKNIDKATTTDEVTTATEAGKKAIDAVHKTNAEQATPTVTGGAVEISVDPNTATNVDSEADKTAIKDAVTVPEGQPQPTKKEILNDGAIKDGKTPGTKVVEVEVTYEDGSKETIEVPVVKKDKAFTVGVKDPAKPIEIPNTPIVGQDLKDEDKEKVKENLLVNSESLKEGDKVEFGKVTQDQDKTVVSVTVTRDGKSETIKVEVTKKSDTTSDQGNQEGSGSQGDQTGQGGTDSQGDQAGQGGTGSQGDQAGQGGTGSQGDQTGQGGTGSQGDQAGQGGTGSQGDQAGQGGTGSQNDQNGQGDSNSNSTNKTELEKAKAQAKSDLAQAAAKEKAEIDADDKLSEDEKAKSKAEVDKVKREQEAKIDEAKTTDEVKTAVENGKKAIDAVHQITPEQAKKDLTEAADKEKGEIGGDTTLTDKEKEALKAKVDEVKKAAEDKINNAKTPEEIAKATEEGKKAIADVYNPQTAKGQSTSIFKPELDLQTALVSGKVTVEKGKDLTDEDILKQLALADGLTAKVISKPTITETGTKEAEVEVTLANGTKVTVKVPVEVVDSLGTADKDNDLAKAKEDAKKQVEEAAKKKLDEIKKDKDLTEDQKQKAEKEINKAKDEANKAIDGASSAGTAKQIADQAKENIEKYDPKADAEVKKPDVTNLDEEKAKAKAEILEEAQKRIDEIKNNKDLSDEAKQKAIEEINKAKDKAIEDINKAQSKDEINAAKEAGIHKINEVQPDGSIASKFEPKVPENKVEVENPAKLSDGEREQVRQNIEGANTFPDGTTVEVKPDGTAVITYKDGSSDTISKDKLVAPANKETGTIASRTEPVIPGKTQVGNTTKLTPEEQAMVKKAVEEANNFPAGTTVEVRPDGTVVITYPDKSVDTITGDKLVEKGSKQETPKVQTDAEKNPAQVPGNFVPVENTHNLTQAEQDTVAAKVKEANPAATDVKVSKDGTATLTYGDGSVNTIPGTSLVVAKDTDNEASTQAAQNPAVVPATTEVGNAHSLTPEEQAEVAAKVQATNPAATVTVSKDGTATLTYSDGSVNTIPGTSLVVQKEETSTQEQPTIAEKTKVIIPANPTKVAEATRLTDAEKEAVKKAVVEANGFGSDVKVEVAGDGTATIVFKDGSAITIPGNQLVAQDPKAQDSTKPTAEKSTVKAPAQRVDVKDITHLTDEEKEKVKVAILQANGSALDGATINVAGDGTATITFPDGSVVTILGKDTVQQSAKGESVTQEATPEYKPETTPGGDKGGNTGSSDANANAGGGSQAGGQAHTGSQNPAQSQASKQLATEKESARNAIEKAAKDKQDEIKGAPLSDKEKAELLARVEAEKQAALKEIENAKTVEDVKEAETIGVQAIAMVTVPKRPVAPNAAPQATSAPQATAGTMQDVTYQSPARKQLPNTGSASSAALASLGLVAATSGFALLGRKARRRK
ncbi:putative surface anchored protein (pseudogene) [Streptococcus pneumoniae]|nr:putative surface anchored protein (pseudogene) [Streptococcus pneumoniae]